MAALPPHDPATLTAGDSSPVVPSPTLPSGAVIGRYVVLHHLGSGAMGVVYAAWDLVLKRSVALKLVRPGARGGGKRLLREAQSMAQLSHPNLATVHDAGEHGDSVFIALELIDGGTLRRWLTDPKRSWRETLGALLQAGRGLAAAHDAGLVHRDFKPENVMVAANGRVVVTDFGIAVPNPSSEGAPATAAGPVGTPGYAAPEQLDGRPAGPAANQFSFCVTAWEAFFGERPLPGVRMQHGRGVPRRLKQLLSRGLSHSPDARHPSMASLLVELERVARPAAARRIAVAAALAALGALAVARATLTTPACSGADALFATVWNERTRGQVERALRDADPANADAVWSTVRSGFDAYGASWAEARTAACGATHVVKDQTEETLELRMQCFDWRLREADALVKLLAAAPPGAPIRAAEAVGALTPARACEAGADLAASAHWPVPQNRRKDVEMIRAGLATANAQAMTARFKEALATLEPLIAMARSVPHAPLEAEILIAKLRAMVRDLGDPKVAQAVAFAAIEAAERGRQQKLSSQGWMELGRIDLWFFDDLSGASRHIGLAQASMEGAGSDPALWVQLENTRAQLLYNQGHYDEAQKVLEVALVQGRRELGEEQPFVLAVLTNMLALHSRSGKIEEGLARQRELLAIRERRDGPLSMPVAAVLESIGTDAELVGRWEEAEQALSRAQPIYAGYGGPARRRTAIVVSKRAVVAARQARFDDAERLHREALALANDPETERRLRVPPLLDYAQTLINRAEPAAALSVIDEAIALAANAPGSEEHAVAVSTRAEALLRLSRPAEAEALAQAAVAAVEKTSGRSAPELGLPLATLAEARVALGQLGPAREAAERALGLTTTPLTKALAQLALARALAPDPAQRPRAQQLAREARAAFTVRRDLREELARADALLPGAGGGQGARMR